MPDQRTWAQAAIATLNSAPAVPDMATQVRCDTCGRVSSSSDLRYCVADRFRIRSNTWGWLLVAALLALVATALANA